MVSYELISQLCQENADKHVFVLKVNMLQLSYAYLLSHNNIYFSHFSQNNYICESFQK